MLTVPPMFSLFTYIALIVGVNFAFTVTPLIPLPNGEMWAPLSLIVGFIFVVRDFAQRRVGHHVLWGMLVGCVVSWFMASPQLALASAAAFAMGELGDWALFTFTNRPFSQRILISSLVGAPLDSVVFLLIIGLAISIPLVIFGANLLLRLMERFPVIITIGAALLGYVAGEMAVTDLAVQDWVDSHFYALHQIVPIGCAALIVSVGKYLATRKSIQA